jgi:hypothetical protein
MSWEGEWLLGVWGKAQNSKSVFHFISQDKDTSSTLHLVGAA